MVEYFMVVVGVSFVVVVLLLFFFFFFLIMSVKSELVVVVNIELVVALFLLCWSANADTCLSLPVSTPLCWCLGVVVVVVVVATVVASCAVCLLLLIFRCQVTTHVRKIRRDVIGNHQQRPIFFSLSSRSLSLSLSRM